MNGAGVNPVLSAHVGAALYWANTTTNSGTAGVVHLTPGDYPLEFTYWQGTGTSSVEVFAARGAETSLQWNVTGANTLSIDQNIGPVTSAIGAVSIAPLLSTTYTLTAVNDYGTTTATVNQPTPIGVSAAAFTARRVFGQAATRIPFAGQGYFHWVLCS